jgi:hypothetical protein
VTNLCKVKVRQKLTQAQDPLRRRRALGEEGRQAEMIRMQFKRHTIQQRPPCGQRQLNSQRLSITPVIMKLRPLKLAGKETHRPGLLLALRPLQEDRANGVL